MATWHLYNKLKLETKMATWDLCERHRIRNENKAAWHFKNNAGVGAVIGM